MEISQLWMNKAEHNLKSCKLLFNKGFTSTIIDMIYMAMFSAVKALLLKKDIECRTHEGLIYLFKINYVDTGLFNPFLFKQFCYCKELKTAYFNYGNTNFSKKEVWIYLNYAIDFIDDASELI